MEIKVECTRQRRDRDSSEKFSEFMRLTRDYENEITRVKVEEKN